MNKPCKIIITMMLIIPISKTILIILELKTQLNNNIILRKENIIVRMKEIIIITNNYFAKIRKISLKLIYKCNCNNNLLETDKK